MSLQDLLNVEQPIMVLVQKDLDAISPGGMPVYGLQNFQTVQGGGRLIPQSARQKQMWQMSLGVECDYQLITEDGTLDTSKFLLTTDSRLFRIVNSGTIHYAKGNIETHYDYLLMEIRRA
jgi:hypothetical protein